MAEIAPETTLVDAAPAPDATAHAADGPPGRDTATAPVLEVRSLHKVFRIHALDGHAVDALHGVDLTVDPGEHVALAGPSGAGKSSLLRCIYRTYLPTSGEVWLRSPGRPPVDLASVDDRTLADLRVRRIGYVSQFLRVEPRRSALEIVAAAGRRRGLGRPEATAVAEEMLARLGLTPAIWSIGAHLLSGGEQQRVNLAAGTLRCPPLLLLDEPFSALDPANRDAVVDLLDDLRSAGVSMVSVFHDHEAMARLADRVVVLRNGRVARQGPPTELRRSPAAPAQLTSPLGDPAPADRWAVHSVRAVTPGGVIDDATVVCEDGIIVEVSDRCTPPAGAVDGRGRWCLPGLVDVHSDGLEREVSPRATARFVPEFALRSFEGRLAAAGVTTVAHGVGFEHKPSYGRSIDGADELCRTIDERARRLAGPVEHRRLHRLEVRSPDGLAAVLPWLETPPPLHPRPPPLLSVEDHTPGQGQYRDVATFRAAIRPQDLPDGMDLDDFVAAAIAEGDAREAIRVANLEQLTALADAGLVRLLAHDCEDAADVQLAHGRGARVAEFPLSVDAAQAARELDMPTVMGAPNVLLGGSHSGNVAAEHLVAEGLCSALASDYQPSTLLAAVFRLVEHGATDLVGAVRLVTVGPAEVLGRHDRGRMEAGARADVVVLDLDGRWPRVDLRHRAPTTPATTARPDLPPPGTTAPIDMCTPAAGTTAGPAGERAPGDTGDRS
ncbi:MAG: alpha-D-ribose 1-methylphosphonate 5-triphosphate diphosphatase [Acidimicrobiia bacterium]|nr:alpha-D-ribose 1-methylphosphonate 5-triphosphate diphosphatase [Acidimicrobiia bacterium]